MKSRQRLPELQDVCRDFEPFRSGRAVAKGASFHRRTVGQCFVETRDGKPERLIAKKCAFNRWDCVRFVPSCGGDRKSTTDRERDIGQTTEINETLARRRDVFSDEEPGIDSGQQAIIENAVWLPRNKSMRRTIPQMRSGRYRLPGDFRVGNLGVRDCHAVIELAEPAPPRLWDHGLTEAFGRRPLNN